MAEDRSGGRTGEVGSPRQADVADGPQTAPVRERGKSRHPYGMAIALVLTAAGVRLAFLPMLGMRAPFITFYPAVMFAAMYGGLGAGLLATVLSALLASYFWVAPAGSLGIATAADGLLMGIYLVSGALISMITEAMHRARARAMIAEGEARVAEEGAQAEEALRASEERYRSLFDNMLDGYAYCRMIHDNGEPSDFVYLGVNDAFARLTGLTDVVGKKVSEVIPGIRESGRELIRTYGRVASTGRSERFETYLEAMGIWFQVSVYSPAKDHFVAVFDNITDRKRAEEALRQSESRLRRLYESDMLGIIYWNMEGQILDANDKFLEMVGYSREDLVAGRIDWLKMTPPEYRHLDEASVQELKATGVNKQPFEKEYLRKDGSRLPIIVVGAMLDEARHNGVAIVMDITERKQAEEQIKAAKASAEQAKEAAEQANKAKDHFLAVLSHELRNPLNPVLATALMLREDPRFDADTREQLDVICRNAELEALLIDDLLDVTRIERGKVELDRRPVDLGTIIHRAVEVCMPDIEARELAFGMDLGPETHWVDADAGRLQQVFWNLIKNAVKFTPVGGHVDIRCRVEDGGYVVAEVNDSGEGIEPAALGRIFNAFEQAERSITRQFGGLGLGLTISKALVELHGGSIAARSEGKGKGATFTVRLPVVAEGATAAGSGPTRDASVATAKPARALRILLVEDHGDTARIMRRLLKAAGHEVEMAADVATALRLAGEHTFDLMLSDLGLPDGSGLDLMRGLRARGSTLPGIALSGFGQESDIEQSLEAGFAAHLTKPVNLARLTEAIGRIAK